MRTIYDGCFGCTLLIVGLALALAPSARADAPPPSDGKLVQSILEVSRGLFERASQEPTPPKRSLTVIDPNQATRQPCDGHCFSAKRPVNVFVHSADGVTQIAGTPGARPNPAPFRLPSAVSHVEVVEPPKRTGTSRGGSAAFAVLAVGQLVRIYQGLVKRDMAEPTGASSPTTAGSKSGL
jgi:hypothetical protein